ncbi:[Arg8]-vasotocin receptor [Liparis tanakae]|uniref:[Arg8]-vasotocin receptor n=1 Tax=Liparis tanakae TaxID=230148 RepID=A0A4Z2EA74_9TELE|nr:[Arg8]-vasotocin receptor [Liparis tanakae]
MVFSGHLLADLPCRWRPRARHGPQDSDSSQRRSTLLSRLQGSRLSDPSRDLDPAGRKNAAQVQTVS